MNNIKDVVLLLICLFVICLIDIDECGTELSNCPPGSYCFNKEGSFECKGQWFTTDWSVWLLHSKTTEKCSRNLRRPYFKLPYSSDYMIDTAIVTLFCWTQDLKKTKQTYLVMSTLESSHSNITVWLSLFIVFLFFLIWFNLNWKIKQPNYSLYHI